MTAPKGSTTDTLRNTYMHTTAVEIVSYKVKPDTSIEQRRATQAGINAFCKAQADFLYPAVATHYGRQ